MQTIVIPLCYVIETGNLALKTILCVFGCHVLWWQGKQIVGVVSVPRV